MFYEPLPGCITSNVRFSNSLERKTWVRYTHAAIQPNRTNKKYSNRKKSNVQSECFKKNVWDQVRMFYFPTSSIEFGHRTKWNSLQKNTSGTKSSSWSSVETPKAIWKFVSFLQWNLYVMACIKRPVFKVLIFRSYKRYICYLYKAATSIKRPLAALRYLSLLILAVLQSAHPWTGTKPYVIFGYFKLPTFTL